MTLKLENLQKILCLSSIIILMSGCASMSEEECLASDWRLIGYEDGAEGMAERRIGDHRKACADYGITPDLSAYKKGREEGLQIYCKAEKGYSLGLTGVKYNGVCPEKLRNEFLKGYDAGREIYVAETKVANKRTELRDTNALLEENRKELSDVEQKLLNSGLSRDDRYELLSEIRRLSKEQESLERKIIYLEKDMATLEEQLERIKLLGVAYET